MRIDSDQEVLETPKSWKFKILFTLTLLILLIIIFIMLTFRFDYAAGVHRIIPTAIDTDLWGNYRVYFRTTPYMRGSDKEYYCVEKVNSDLALQIREAILNNQEIIVFYNEHVGFKGIKSPKGSPIVRIEYADGSG